MDCGVNGVLVSTHGGRQMDATLSAIEPAGGRGGLRRARRGLPGFRIRRGGDVLKHGPRRPGGGRGAALYWGLAVNGAKGAAC